MVELIICEKPSAAQKVALALADGKPAKKANKKVPYYELTSDGKKVVVCAAVGHLYNLAETKKNGWKYPVFDIDWKAANEISKDSAFVKGYIETIKKLAGTADTFTLACDYDVEGELIGLNALRFACKQKDGNRMKFSTLTKPDLLEAYQGKTPHIDWGQANAGETRHKLDWFYGINLSRALTASIKAVDSFKIMSIGRVQGPALKTIVDREKEILAFKPVPFWQIFMLWHAHGKDCEAWHITDKFWKESEAKTAFDKVKGEKKATVESVERTQYKQPPPYPFDLTSLQTESYGQHGISPKETLAIAQRLYLAGVISYPRTSSQQLTPKLGFPSILKHLAGQKAYAPLCDILLKQKKLEPNNGKKTDPAHPAIYPTGVTPKAVVGRDMKVYDLIVKRFLATFGPEATRETMVVMLVVKGEQFKAEGKRTLVPGWHVLYQPYLRNKEVELPDVKKGDMVDVKKIDLMAKETQPPKRYTPSSIIKELEKRNLGTKATRADIVDTLFNRGYVEGTHITATQFGIQVVDTLVKHSPKILDEELTKTFEEHMEHIREGKEKPERVLTDAQTMLTGILKDFKAHEKDIGAELLKAVREARDVARSIGSCPRCKRGTLKITMNKATRKHFLGCDQYPACETTFPLPQNALVKPEEKPCEACGFARVLVIRKRARPQQLCINPDCPTKKLEKEEEKKVKDIESGKVEKKCPDCGGLLVVRRSFYGQFIGCSSYPKCRHTEKLDGEKKVAPSQKKTI